MPIYAIGCSACGSTRDIFRHVKEYDDLPPCCGKKMERKLTAPYVQPDIQPYKSMVTGEMITSRSVHRNHLKSHGMVEIGNETQKVRTEVKPPDNLKRDIAEVIAGYGG